MPRSPSLLSTNLSKQIARGLGNKNQQSPADTVAQRSPELGYKPEMSIKLITENMTDKASEMK